MLQDHGRNEELHSSASGRRLFGQGLQEEGRQSLQVQRSQVRSDMMIVNTNHTNVQ